jgi:anti-sigma factor RsiW
MSHLDEGTLHALLDGELDSHEVREIQAHLGSCTACDSRFQAAKDVYGEADRLVGSVQVPGALRGMKGAEAAPAGEPVLEPRRADGSEPRKRRIEAMPVTSVGAPQVVFLPEQNEGPERRRRWIAMGKWAAVLAVAVGAGFLASEARNEGAAGMSIRAADSDEPNWVVSRDEMTEGDTSPMPPPAAARPARSTPESALVKRTDTKQKAEPKPAAPKAPVQPPDAGSRFRSNAALDTSAALGDAAAAEPSAEEQPAESQENIRAEAAEALAQLDAQRRRERAAAATAAIDQTRRDQVTRTPAAGAAQVQAAPAPQTLEQRSGIYLRIGLDEAARQLGRPVHVIEGMGAQFMGLVQGSQAPGADDNRPAVRVVYQDTQGRMILLDQQRIRPGQTWPSGAYQWAAGEIGLALHGDVPGEVLRNLRPRVR